MRPLALITGASSGIGAAFARRLAADGYNLILVARRIERLEELALELGAAHGIRAEVLSADLAEEVGVRAVEQRIASLPQLDLLINNAGFGSLGRFSEIPVESQERMHRVHVLATLRLARAALGGMIARRSGGIINVSSVAGFQSTPGSVSYCATKTWMNRFTEGLYLELKSTGSPVRVQALCPGFTHTEFHDTLGADRKRIPASLWMRTEDVVAASLAGLAKGKLFVIPGWRYRVFVALSSRFPRWLRHSLSIRYARAARRDSARRE